MLTAIKNIFFELWFILYRIILSNFKIGPTWAVWQTPPFVQNGPHCGAQIYEIAFFSKNRPPFNSDFCAGNCRSPLFVPHSPQSGYLVAIQRFNRPNEQQLQGAWNLPHKFKLYLIIVFFIIGNSTGGSQDSWTSIGLLMSLIKLAHKFLTMRFTNIVKINKTHIFWYQGVPGIFFSTSRGFIKFCNVFLWRILLAKAVVNLFRSINNILSTY